jgi:energy-coupling factor transporter ATP-binding protein EcfA2
MALIEVCGLEYEDLGRRILSGVTFSIEEGERVAILGPNSSGKTVLAMLLAGWLPEYGLAAKSGSMKFEGRPWKDFSLIERAGAVQLVGTVPLPQLSGREFTVRDEIAFGPGNLGLDEGEVCSRVEEALIICGLESLQHRDPHALSGGEQQRVVLAGALAMRPRVLVLDEPLSNLDPSAASRILGVLERLPLSTTIILLDSSPWIAVRMAYRFILLKEGRCLADGRPESVLLHSAAIASLGLTVPAETALTASRHGCWDAGVAVPFTVEVAASAFREVALARR